MRLRHWGFAFVVLFSATAAGAQSLTDPNLHLSTFVSGLSSPTGFRFISPGGSDLFAIEKDTGKVQFVHNGAVQSTALDLNVVNNSERGLLGIALHPAFNTDPTKRYGYFYYSHSSTEADTGDGANWTDNRLERFTWNGTNFTFDRTLLVIPRDPDQNNGPNHDGGPILFGSDGKLYGALGELNRERLEENFGTASDPSSKVGGIYRLNDDGTIPADNPFAANANPDLQKWYAYGVRNSFGMAVDPSTGKLWDTENGPDRMDEINQTYSGFNSGWKTIMGPVARDPEGNTPADLVTLPGASYGDPKFSWNATIGVTGIDFLADSTLGASYTSAVVTGDINNGNLYRMDLNAARDGFALSGGLADLVADSDAERNSLLLGTGFGGVTQIEVGTDGALYVASFGNGSIYRIAGPAVPEPSTRVLTILGALAVNVGARWRSCLRSISATS